MIFMDALLLLFGAGRWHKLDRFRSFYDAFSVALSTLPIGSWDTVTVLLSLGARVTPSMSSSPVIREGGGVNIVSAAVTACRTAVTACVEEESSRCFLSLEKTVGGWGGQIFLVQAKPTLHLRGEGRLDGWEGKIFFSYQHILQSSIHWSPSDLRIIKVTY